MLRTPVWSSLFGVLLLVLACGSEGPGDGDAGVVRDQGAGSGFVGEYFVLVRLNTSTGRTMYSIVTDGLDVGEIDLGTALELSGLSRVRSFEGKLYAFDGESGQATRWAVTEDRGFAVDTLDDGMPARMTFAPQGVTSFSNAFAFVSAERAFYFDTFGMDQIIEFNPTTMTITQTMPAALTRAGFAQVDIGSRALVTGDYVVFPISWTDFSSAMAAETAALAVLDLSGSEPVFSIVEDDRCMGAVSLHEQEGFVYTYANSLGAIAASNLSPGDLPPPCMLRWTPGDAAFDADFMIDLEALTGQSVLSGGRTRGDGILYASIYAGDEPSESLDVFELTDGPYWQLVRIDLTSGETTVMEDFPPADAASGARIVEGEYVFVESQRNDPVQVYQLGADDRREPLLSVSGDVFRIERLR